jgi:hypothetical protein
MRTGVTVSADDRRRLEAVGLGTWMRLGDVGLWNVDDRFLDFDGTRRRGQGHALAGRLQPCRSRVLSPRLRALAITASKSAWADARSESVKLSA